MNYGKECAALARLAAEIIQKRGKADGEFMDSAGRVCAMGAIELASHEVMRPRIPRVRIVDGVIRHVRRVIRTDPSNTCNAPISIPEWSDHPRTTELTIAKVFLQVADEIEVAE